MKRIWTAVLVGVVSLTIAGCNGGGASSGGQESSAGAGAPSDDAIRVEQIDYEVTSGVIDGSRRAIFNYTNNSDYTIIGLNLEMVFPDDVDQSAIEEAYDYILDGDVEVDDILDSTMSCEDEFEVEPGEESRDATCSVYGHYVVNVEQYELMEPDMLTIRFISDGLIYEEYYDFRSESYSLSSDVIDPNQWAEGEFEEAAPKPEDALVVDTSESDTRFSFEIAAMTQDEFEAYVDAFREAGYTVDIAQTDMTYYADNEDGVYHIDLMYWDENGRLNGYVDYIEQGE